MNKALISVVIPAYNLPEYTAKTIDSIMSQTYRPIEIVISDDNSPISLKALVKAKQDKCDAGINIKYFRQQLNLGYYGNLQFVQNEAVGKYFLMLDHDDWLIDNDFFTESINAMESKSDCFISFCNSLYEKSTHPFLDIYYENWHYINGGAYIKNNLFNDLTPARGAVIMRLDKLRDLNYKDYFIDNASAKKISIYPDEAFVSIYLLASLGSVAVSGRMVSIEGEPIGSNSTTIEWESESFGIKAFAQYFKLYEYFKKTNFHEGVDAIFQNFINIHLVSKINIALLRYLKFQKLAIVFMSISFLKYNIRLLFSLPRNLFIKLKILVTGMIRKIFKF